MPLGDGSIKGLGYEEMNNSASPERGDNFHGLKPAIAFVTPINSVMHLVRRLKVSEGLNKS